MLVCENVRLGWASAPKRELAGLPWGLKLREKSLLFLGYKYADGKIAPEEQSCILQLAQTVEASYYFRMLTRT